MANSLQIATSILRIKPTYQRHIKAKTPHSDKNKTFLQGIPRLFSTKQSVLHQQIHHSKETNTLLLIIFNIHIPETRNTGPKPVAGAQSGAETEFSRIQTGICIYCPEFLLSGPY